MYSNKKLLIIFSFCFFGGKSIKGQSYESIYKYSGIVDSINLTDVLNRKIANFSNNPVKLAIGDVMYRNVCNRKVSITDIYIETKNGISALNEKGDVPSAKIIVDFDNKTYIGISNDDTVKKINYFIPALQSTDKEAIINNYSCSLFTYSAIDNEYLIEFWFCKKIPAKVNLGFINNYGGLVKVAYYTKKNSFSFDLVSYKKEEEDQLQNIHVLSITNKTSEIHPLFTIN